MTWLQNIVDVKEIVERRFSLTVQERAQEIMEPHELPNP